MKARWCMAGGRRVCAGLSVALYLAAVIVLPGLHLWRHADDHDHVAGGIHYRLNDSSAEPHSHDDDHDHDHVAADHDTAEPFDEASSESGSLLWLGSIDSQHAPENFTVHAAGSLAHFASSYLAPKPGLPAPLSLPACIQAIRTLHQARLARGILRGTLGARAPPSALSA